MHIRLSRVNVGMALVGIFLGLSNSVHADLLGYVGAWCGKRWRKRA
jgi:hypothetical protein